jgi:hypothetical protein
MICLQESVLKLPLECHVIVEIPRQTNNAFHAFKLEVNITEKCPYFSNLFESMQLQIFFTIKMKHQIICQFHQCRLNGWYIGSRRRRNV